MNKMFYSLIFVLFLLYGCGGGSSPQPSIELTHFSMSGRWEGTITFDGGGSQQVNFIDIVENGANISGVHEVVRNGTADRTEDVSGSVTNATVTISAIYTNPDNDDYVEHIYDGTIDGGVYQGNIKIIGSTDNEPNTDQKGTFTFTKIGDDDPPSAANISGVWQGWITTPNPDLPDRPDFLRQVRDDATFELSVSGRMLSGKFTSTFPQGSQTTSTTDLTGVVDDSTVDIVVTLGDPDNYLHFVGLIRENSLLDGNLTVVRGKVAQVGAFSFTKNAN